MTYDKIQFVGYAINTEPKRENGKQVYLGLDNAKQDIDARCILMQRAMETARAKIKLDPQPDTTLTVFMAPEFFFRGKRGAYDMDHVQYAISQLQKLAGKDEWKNWLIVFGTILGEWDQTNVKKRAVNFALIQQGGAEAHGSDGARTIVKELKSHIDFISDAKNSEGILLAGIEYMDPGPVGPGREAQFINYDGAGIFEACGITWAADICRDHISGRLLKSPQLPGSNEIQVQLIPSGGASIKARSVIAEDGGFVFNVDGNLREDRSTATVTLMNNRPPLAPIACDSTTEVPNCDIDLPNVSPPEKIPTRELYRFGSGNIVIHAPVDTPQPKVVKGTVVNLKWDSRRDIELDFSIIYGTDGKYITTLCEVQTYQAPTTQNKYFLPLDLNTKDRLGEKFQVKSIITEGAMGYDKACRCFIISKDYDFTGIAFLFNNNSPDTLPKPATPKTIF